MLVTNEMLYNEILSVKREIALIKKSNSLNSVEEVSLSKACKMLHLGSDKVLDLVRKNLLEARTYTDSKGVIRYRFKVSSLRNIQSGGFETLRIHSPQSFDELINKVRSKKC